MASFTKEVNSRLAKRPLVFNGRLANRGLTSLVKEATGREQFIQVYVKKYVVWVNVLITLHISWVTQYFPDDMIRWNFK